ncbi:prepilin-type N-terminal cleavage/methylation domain-containing protein [Virgibacillus halodenitrificans]|uniref:prepilin-type N-terminal cleavage/methylation domain-containing protein n=1 Tax=Virgibacillus halodenitrificans TaxID=1482 RepID=UPI002DBF95CB|nr:prepilin-type N-terminal cleavage/methylation domain-containing protein [Virgibacillus halodenitrificans]MEC2159847.1 prepilin-type N-terminal cleavage/methylation domain-containing protein [Virgibacillus halodenitrificans]
MRICQFKSEKGMTLVELLAALVLFGLIVALSSGVIVQLMGSEQKTSASISLKQEANVAMSELRSQFYNNDTNKICLSPDTPLQVKDSLIINGEEEEKQLDSNNCITDVDHEESMEIEVTFSDTANKQEIALQTSWAGRKKHLLTLDKVDRCDDDEDEDDEDDHDEGDDDGDDDDKDDGNCDNGCDDDEEDFDDYIEGDITSCFFNEEVKFSSHVNTGNGNPNCNKITFEEDAVFLKGLLIHNHVEMKAKDDLYIKKGLTMQPQSDLVVDDDLCILGGLTVKPNASMTVEDDLYLEGNIDIKGKLCVRGEFKNKEKYKDQLIKIGESCYTSK